MLDSDFPGSSGMMVLLEKQVHLQKEVGANRVSMRPREVVWWSTHSRLGLVMRVIGMSLGAAAAECRASSVLVAYWVWLALRWTHFAWL